MYIHGSRTCVHQQETDQHTHAAAPKTELMISVLCHAMIGAAACVGPSLADEHMYDPTSPTVQRETAFCMFPGLQRGDVQPRLFES